jgi:hypothetical protein
MRRRLGYIAPAAILVMALITSALGIDRTPNTVVSAVAGCAGAPAAGSGFAANGTAGQAAPTGVASGGGVILYGGFWGPRTAATTGIATPDAGILRTELQANYPNPFNPQTAIAFTLAAPGRVRLDVFDARGQLVRALIDETRPSGRYQAIWDGTDVGGRRVASGLYLYRLRAGDYESVRKMTVVK